MGTRGPKAWPRAVRAGAAATREEAAVETGEASGEGGSGEGGSGEGGGGGGGGEGGGGERGGMSPRVRTSKTRSRRSRPPVATHRPLGDTATA